MNAWTFVMIAAAGPVLGWAAHEISAPYVVESPGFWVGLSWVVAWVIAAVRSIDEG